MFPRYEKNAAAAQSKNLCKYKHEDSSVSHISQNHLPTSNREIQIPLLKINYRSFPDSQYNAIFL